MASVQRDQRTAETGLKVAVLVPCYNEATTISEVVTAFRAALPDAEIYVYDNNSTDATASLAASAGAIVRREPIQGKGNVVRRMFADVDAEVYVLVDGDATYDALAAPEMIDLLVQDRLEMVNGARTSKTTEAYRTGHRFGNRVLSSLVRMMFGARIKDMLSGYKIFSRRFVKTFPAHSAGFEIETELVVHALELRMAVAEVSTTYGERPEGSSSKLHTIRDGFRILLTILELVKEERPLLFFSSLAGCLLLFSVILGMPVITEYVATGLVPRLPSLVVSGFAVILAFVAFACGLILDTVTRGRREIKRLAYLQERPPAAR